MIKKLRRRFSKRNLLIASLLFLSPPQAFSESDKSKQVENIFEHGVVVDLRDPMLKDGVLSTSKGGVITAKDIRIQAKNISYTRKEINGERILKVEASDSLMVEYGDRVFTGKRVVYDFITQRGQLFEGTTGIAPWYIGGEEILLEPNGEYTLKKGYITTCENAESEWQISASNVHVPKNNQIAASNIQIRFLELPLFWMPSFSGNVKRILRAPVRWQAHWGGSQGSRVTMRYRFLSTEHLNAFMRIDYRLKRGFGGGIETDYNEESFGNFKTRNYYANDSSIADSRERTRFRFEGKYFKTFHEDKTSLEIKYDRLSDSEMPSDFDDSSFDLETAQRTELALRRTENIHKLSLVSRLRINDFQTLKQELPTLEWRVKPFSVGDTGILFDNDVKLSYLSFEHATKIGSHRDFESSRLTTQNFAYKPFNYNNINITPTVGVVGTFYDKSPQSSSGNTVHSVLALGSAQLEMNSKFYRHYGNHKHVISPYTRFEYYKLFEDGPDDHYVFDFDDAWSNLSMLRFGVKNNFYSKDDMGSYQTFATNLYANAFFKNSTVSNNVPKIYFNGQMTKYRNFLFSADTAWDTRENSIDRYNLLAQWTKDEDFALSAEYRSRNELDYKKADRDNFFLEAFRNESTLKSSTLSDKRNTILGNVFYRIAPKWVAHLQSRTGMGRNGAPDFNELQADVITTLRCSWIVTMSYQLTEDDSRVSVQVRLAEGPPLKRGKIPLIWP